MTKKLVVIGSINVDHILTLVSFPKPGETQNGADYHITFGGKGANQALAAARSGASTQFIAAIGDNDIGQDIVDHLKKEHINIQNIEKIPAAKTGVALIFVNQKGENEIGIYGGANTEVTPSFLSRYRAVITGADLLLMQLEIPLESIETAAMWAKENNVPVMLNPAPAKSLSDTLLSCIDIITPNQTETETLTGISVENTDDAKRAAAILHQKGIPIVIITLGHQGIFVSHREKDRHIPAHTVSVTDTIAAGDTFCGAMAAALLNGKTLEEAAVYGNSAAAIAVTRRGAQASIPHQEEVMNFIAQHVNKI